LKQLESRLATFKSKNPGFPVIVKGNSVAQYQEIMNVLDVVGRLGITEVGLVTQPPK
jgi:biopolymer transport protein ExbD